MKAEAMRLGFRHVEAGPMVRSSYHARDQVPGRTSGMPQRAVVAADGRVVVGA
jgi:lipoic acid synthetase